MQLKTINKILENARSYRWVLEPDAKKLLAAAQIPVPNFGVFQDKAQAIEFAQKLSFPVVAKVVSPAIVHKTEVGGVRTGIQDQAELAAAFDQFARHKQFAGILVEEMLEGVELIIGGKNDPQFGPVILAGMGGIGVEIYKDTAIRMAPITRQEALDMLSKLKGTAILSGFRGKSAIDIKALLELMVAFSKLLNKIHSTISSVDLNPVFCSPRGCVVADARIMLIP